MIKKFSLCIIMALLLLTVASAHPGRTDSHGGHYDSETGEYHYHHGYAAHQHTDLDGDGKADCPYNFDDQTDHNSGNSSSETYVRSEETAVVEKAKHRSNLWLYIVAAFALWVLYRIIKSSCEAAKMKAAKKAADLNSFNEAMKELNSIRKTAYNSEVYDKIAEDERGYMLLELQEQMDSILARKADFDRNIRYLSNELATQYNSLCSRLDDFKKNYRALFSFVVDRYAPIPEGCYIGPDRLPHTEEIDKYTFYRNRDSCIYHSRNCYHARNAFAINAAEIDGRYMRPCYSCNPQFDLSWYYRRKVYLQMHEEVVSLLNCKKVGQICLENSASEKRYFVELEDGAMASLTEAQMQRRQEMLKLTPEERKARIEAAMQERQEKHRGEPNVEPTISVSQILPESNHDTADKKDEASSHHILTPEEAEAVRKHFKDGLERRDNSANSAGCSIFVLLGLGAAAFVIWIITWIVHQFR